MEEEKIAVFLEEAKAFPWFENSGIPNEKYHMVFSLYDACDGLWGMQYFEVWESQIYPLEDTAEEKIGDDAIDEIFEVVLDAIGDTVWKKFEEYIVRQHVRDDLEVRYELFDKMRRDMAWACVEKVLDTPVFLPCWQKSIRKGIFRVHGTGNILPAGWCIVAGEMTIMDLNR